MTRREEIRAIHKRRHRLFYKWLGVLAIISACIFIGAMLFNIGAMLFDDEDHNDYRLNFATEVMGVLASIGFTVLIIDRWYAHRERENLKRRLVREARSRSNDIAISAVEWLRDEGWLMGNDGLLQEADLSEANLKRAYLGGANLQEADLTGANLQEASLGTTHLQGANLRKSNLQGVDLTGAKLQGANLSWAKLQGADLTRAKLQRVNLTGAKLQGAVLSWAKLQEANLFGANLQEANLFGVNLQRANLLGVNLQRANLSGANLSGVCLLEADLNGTKLERTILPDAEIFDTRMDMERFTNPKHSEFATTHAKINNIRKNKGMERDDEGESR